MTYLSDDKEILTDPDDFLASVSLLLYAEAGGDTEDRPAADLFWEEDLCLEEKDLVEGLVR